MRSYAKYIQPNQSFVEFCGCLADLPSPRTLFFNHLMSITGLSPNYLKMVLCATSSGERPGRSVIERVSENLEISEVELFPEQRLAEGSLVSLYMSLPSSPVEYTELIKDICEVTHSSKNSVISWMYGRHTPRPGAKNIISTLLGKSIDQLFPQVDANTQKDSSD